MSELRSFLGMITYYQKFLENYSTLVHPLNQLLKKGIAWSWTDKCQSVFEELKEKLSRAPVLAHYDSQLPLKLDTGAVAHGVGAVISHVSSNGQEHPVAYASRTLSNSKQNYSQVEREALAIIFAVKKFYCYLFGLKFLLVTDHKPLCTIFCPKTGVPPIAAARIQRWALFLSAFQYDIVYRSTAKHSNADCLSRLPLQSELGTECDQDVQSLHSMQIDILPINVDHMRTATRYDPSLSRVLKFMLEKWSSQMSLELQPFFTRKDELATMDGYLLWGMRVIVSAKHRKQVLEELHIGHPGIVHMKSFSRIYDGSQK